VVYPPQGTVNVRSGPGTNFNIVAQLQPNQTLPVLGQSNGWYQIEVPGVPEAWVANSVVALSGICNNIPQVNTNGDNGQIPTLVPLPQQTEELTPANGQATLPPPTQVPQQGPSATAPPQQIQQSTPTSTPSYTPTTQPLQATPTYTPSYTPTTPTGQLAPEDARFNNPLNIQLDSTASVLDFVSYPGGDTEDRVRWDIIGMNNNSSLPGGRARLVISVSCFGQNTNQVQFFTGGQTYSCGQAIVDQEVTAGSKTGSVVITAVGGTGTYVQWVLTGTATRLN
jgi:uncharacterized protein YraI